MNQTSNTIQTKKGEDIPQNPLQLNGSKYCSLSGSTLAKLRSTAGLGPSTLSIIKEAESRGIPWRRMNDCSKILFGYGKNQQIIRATITGQSSCVAVELADSKYETKKILQSAGIPVPEGQVCSSPDDLRKAVTCLGFPLVIKPMKANHGKGVSVQISDEVRADEAFFYAQKFGSEVIVERCISGHDHRLLVVNGKLVAAARRIPAHIRGDGTSTVHQLITKVNSQPERGDGHEAELTKIIFDCDTVKILQQKGYNENTVVPAGETVYLKSTANLSTGGIAADVTDEVHSENRFIAERIAALIGLDVCGIDIIAPDLKAPLSHNGGAVIEVNAAPGFRMHLKPSVGQPRNVASAVVDMLYPPGSEIRIPIFAVTGTNGKTTTTRLLAHIVQSAGHSPGYTTTDGIYISGHKIVSGDCSGPSSASTILADPLVDFAVLETARGGMLRSGLAFDYCDVAILTNIAADHLGLRNINTLEELAEVKAALLRSVKKSGWAILNAEDEHCVRVAGTLDCNIAYFALDSRNAVIRQHIKDGGWAVTVEQEKVVVHHNRRSTIISTVKEIPLTMCGTARCMTANVLAAVAAAFCYGFSVGHIRMALKTFLPGPDQTPGRMNLFQVGTCSVLVDYAHNPHGMKEVQHYLSHITGRRKVGIIAGVGDRRDCDILELAEIAARCFDHIIVRQDNDLRGRSLNEMNLLMVQGIRQADTEVTVDLIPDEKEAIKHALATAQEGDYIVALSDNYKEVIKVISKSVTDR